MFGFKTRYITFVYILREELKYQRSLSQIDYLESN